MKKIWLRKEREDSKSQQESKSGSSESTFKKDEVTLSQPSNDIESKGGSDGIAEHNVGMESEIRENEDRGSSKMSQKFLSSLPESSPYQGSFYHPMDASHVHSAYILAIQGAMDSYQLQRQIHFTVPSPFPFMPMAQTKKFADNGSHYDLPQAGNYDSYLIQSSREDRRFSNQSMTSEKGHEPSKSCDLLSQNQSKFDYSHFSYSLKASFQQQLDKHNDHYHLRGSDLGSDSKNLRPTFARPEPFVSQVRKRAPNSPLEVPITPTILPGHDMVSAFPRAFVVPRNMMRLSCREEETDSGNRRNAETTVGILPTVIANMTELEVNDNKKLTKPSNNNSNSSNNNNYIIDNIKNNNKEATSSATQFTNSVPNFRPYESIVTSSSLCGNNTHPVGKTEHRVTFKMDERLQENDKRAEENRMDNNNNNRDTRSTASIATGHPKERVLSNVVSMPHSDDSVSNGDAIKDQSNPTVTTTVMTSRGKGRPAKTVGKPGADLSTAGGLRSVIKCPTCMKVFNNSSALAKHKLTHSDERKYSCHLCSKAFKRQDHLNGHMMTHSSKKPFECKFLGCSKSYCDARSLRRHLENHHHDSINSCNGAGFMPGRMDEGRPVAQTHVQPDSCTLPQLSDDAWNSKVVWAPGFNPLDEPKPVRCHVCGRRFKNVPALNGHMRLHGGYVNRDTEDDVDRQNDDVTTSLETTKRKSWEAKTKVFEGKPNYQSASDVVTQGRASSLERLTSSHGDGGGCSTSSTPWDLTKDELDRIKSKSYSLPREESKFKERGPLWREDVFDQSEKLQDWKAPLIGQDSSLKTREIPIEDGRSTSSAVIDLTNDEALYTNKRGEFVNAIKKEDDLKMNEMTRDVDNFHYSKYSSSFQTIAAVQCSKGDFEGSTMDLSRKLRCLESGSEISPKHLEASSLYQRRLRRFSERSPNSDESSRHSAGTQSPLNLEKSTEKELRENDFASVKLNFHGSHDLLSKKVLSQEEKSEFFVARNLISHEEEFREASRFPSSKIPCDKVVNSVNSVTSSDLKQCQEKISNSHPCLYQNSAEPNRPFPVNNSSGDLYSKPVCSSFSVQHGTPVENPNVSLQHQSHSSLPCTPYTAHTPYTPRTTEPSSPRKAGFFQFPPNQQHEGSKIPSMEVPSISAFDHDNPMETARIPEVQSGNFLQDDSAMLERAVKKQGGERKPSSCKTRKASEEVKVCDRARAPLHEEVSSSQESASSSSEDSAHLNYLKARGKIIEQSVTQSKSETSVLQEKQKEKLSARRKAKPAPLVLPPQKEMKERYMKRQGREMDDPVSSSDRRSQAPSPVPILVGVEQSRTALQSTVSSVDSGCPKSSARFSVNDTPSGFLPQSGDSLVFNHLKEHCATSNASNFQSSQRTKQQTEILGERTKDGLSEASVKIGPEYQAAIPQLEYSRCIQKEKAELWLTSKKDWPDTIKGRLQVNQGMLPILLHLEKGPPR